MQPAPGGNSRPGPFQALEALDAVLDRRHFATTMTIRPGQPPRLMVTSRLTRLRDDICADHQSYRSSHNVPIAAVDNPQAAARTIAAMLRAIPPPGHD